MNRLNNFIDKYKLLSYSQFNGSASLGLTELKFIFIYIASVKIKIVYIYIYV